MGCCHFCVICDACNWMCSLMGIVCASSCRWCVFGSVVHPVAILSAVFCVICSLLMFVSDASGDHMVEAPDDTAYKRWRCHSGHKLLCKLCRTFPPELPFLGKPAMRTRCSSQNWVMSRLIQVRQHYQMRRYPPSTIHKYLDLPSTQIIQNHTSHRHNTTPRLQTLVQAPTHSPPTPPIPP